MAKLSGMPPDLVGADFCDELATSIADLRKQIEATTKRVATIEEQLIVIDRKLTDCCSDSLRLEVSALRADVAALKLPITPPTG